MSKSALHWDTCKTHGYQLHLYSTCVSCASDARPPKPAIAEPIPAWMRKAIERMDTKQAPERTRAIKRMEKWKSSQGKRKTAAEERKARAERWFTPIGAGDAT